MRNPDSGISAGEPRRGTPLEELLQLHDEEFVRAAYERVLGRSPAAAEIDQWLAQLRSGSLSRKDALIAIRYSAEGRERGVPIPGLAAGRLIRIVGNIPVLGHVARWFRHLLLLPGLARRMNAIEANFAASVIGERALVARSLADLAGELRRVGEAKADRQQAEQSIARLADEMHRLDEAKANSGHVERSMARLADEMRRLDESKANLGAFAEAATRLHAVSSIVTDLEEVLRRWGMLPLLPGAGDGGIRAIEDFYRRFEDRFRGTRQEVLARLSFYTPMLRTAMTNSVGPPPRFLDLGCGRGEMVQLLRDNGLPGYGVDQSSAMVALCRGMGLDAVQSEALAHLESLASDSLTGITSIHVIEHLPFRTLAMLFDEAFRVLRPGGIAIFETPNPENLIVGACNFHYDPTHVRPLPPEPTRFILESSGFERVAIERLHPGATPADIEAATDPVARMYSTMMLVPQDYALIAYKPSSRVPGMEGQVQ